MKFVGIDLAWTYKNETGICIMSDDGEIEYLNSAILSNEDIVTLIKHYCNERICIAIDAPLIVKNETGSREAERNLMRNKIHGYNLSLFVASRSYLIKTFGEIRGETLLNLILNEIPGIEINTMVSEVKSTVIETFPSAVCCGVFPDIYPVKYKLKRTVPYTETQYQMNRLLSRLRILEEEEGIVKNLVSELNLNTIEICQKNHKHIEDKIDAFLSAYCIYSIYNKIAKPVVFGDIEEGFITISVIEKPSILSLDSMLNVAERKLNESDVETLKESLINLERSYNLSKKEQNEILTKLKKDIQRIEVECRL